MTNPRPPRVGLKSKLGVSTWSLLSLDLVSAIRAVGDAGFEYIELWGEVPHAYPEWVDASDVKDGLSSYDMLLTLHAPFTDLNPASPFQPMKSAVEKTLEGYVDFGASLGAAIITVHPGRVHSEALLPKAAPNVASCLKKMVKTAQGRLRISVENQAVGRSKYDYPLATTVESIGGFLSDVEGLNLTLDTGHAHVSGQELAAFAERAGSRLCEVHLHDNAGTSDDHLAPGQGTIDLSPLRSSVRPETPVCLELDPYRYPPDEAIRAALSFKALG